MIELGSDIFLGGLDQASVAFEIRIVLAHEAAGRFGLSDPFLDGRQVMHLFRMQQRFHDAAIGMAAHNDMGNFEDRHRILDGRRAPALHRSIGRDHVAGIPEE